MNHTSNISDTLDGPREWVDEHLTGVPAAVAELQINMVELVGEAIGTAVGAVATASERAGDAVRTAGNTVTGTAQWVTERSAKTIKDGNATLVGQTKAQIDIAAQRVSDEAATAAGRVREVANTVDLSAERVARAANDELAHAHIGTYSDMTKSELYDLATERDIDGRSNMNKGLLVAALRADDAK